MSFSYDLVSLKSYPCGDTNCCNDTICRGNKYCWKVIEKGLRHLASTEKHKIYHRVFYVARKTLMEMPSMKTSRCCKSSLLRDQDFNIYLKSEPYQPLHSVKARGVMYTLKKLSKKSQNLEGVVTVSIGSFAYILCHYGNMFKIPVIVVMPTTVTSCLEGNRYFIQCQTIGSLITVVTHGNDILEAHNHAVLLARQNGYHYLDKNDHPYMIIGQATLGLEIVEEVENVDAVILPTTIDNCGLTTGIAMAIKEVNPEITIIEVKHTNCDTLVQKIRSKTMLMEEVTNPPILPETYKWDSSDLSKKIMIDHHIRTNEDSISTASDILCKTEGFYDYYTAIGLAPFVEGKLDKLKGKRVVIPVFGEIDRPSIPRSDPSVPCAGPSTSHE